MKISYIGLKTQEVPIKAGTIRILMKPDAEVLEEVVVTGMQKMDKRLFTGATQQLTADNVKLDGLPDISRGLEGPCCGCVSPERIRYVWYCSLKSVYVVLPPFMVAPNHYGWWMELLWKMLLMSDLMNYLLVMLKL